MADERIIRALLRFGLDSGAATQTEQGVKKVGEGLKTVEKNADAVKRKLNELRESAEKLRMVGTTLAGVGAAILAPVGLAVNAYVSKIGEAGVVSRQWVQATKEIEESQMRVGRVAAQELLPYLKDAASLARQVAAFVEQNPDAIKAALIVGGAAVAGGGAIAGIATAVSTGTALIQVLTTAGIIGTGAAAAGGAAGGVSAFGAAVSGIILPVAAATAAVIALGAGVKNWVDGFAKDVDILSNNLLATSANFDEYQKKIAELKKNPLFGLINPGFYEAKDEASFKAAKELYGSNGPQPFAAPSPFGSGGSATPPSSGTSLYDAAGSTFRSKDQAAALAKQLAELNDLYAQVDEQQQKRADAERQGQADLVALDADYAAEQLRRKNEFLDNEAQLQQDYDTRRLNALRDFALSEARTAEDYYAARLENSKKYDKETQAAEADHQKQMLRMREDNSDELDDLARSRDALGYVKALRRQEKERQRAEDDYKTEIEQRDQAFAEDLAAQETQYRKEKQRRDYDFQQRLSDEKYQFDLSASRRKAAQALQDAAELTAYTNQRKKLQTQTQSILTDITRVFNSLQTRINTLAGTGATVPGSTTNSTGTVGTGPTVGMRAAGGYADMGRYWLGERGREFVLDAQTTLAAERVTGGGLSQERLLRGLSGGAAINIDGISVNGTDVASAARLAGQLVEQKIIDAVRRQKGRA